LTALNRKLRLENDKLSSDHASFVKAFNVLNKELGNETQSTLAAKCYVRNGLVENVVYEN
jgi:hypothetical protein